MGVNPGQSTRSAGRQRLALIAFAIVFVLLFVGFAVAQGLGASSVPSGDVAKVESVPSEISTVSEKDFKRALAQQVKQGKLKKVPAEDSEKYEELKTAALGELLDQIWIRGEAEELGISVTDKQIETELKQIKKQNFKTEKAYQEFLKESNFTEEDVTDRVRLQLLSTQIQEVINSAAPKVGNEEIQNYYEAELASQFTTPASRDVRVIVNEDKSKVEAAKKALDQDNSAAAWKKAAKKYSSDPSTKSKGGLQSGVTEEFVQGPLKTAIFDSATGEVVGPVNFEKNYLLLEVVKLNPAKVQKLGEVRSQISSTLSQEVQQEFFSEFVTDYQTKWTSRTHCASGFVIERCSNYVGDGHPANAAPACYEADPAKPATECPSPVTPNSPALPGTVTPLKPKGEPFPQRPLPEPAAEGAEGAEGAPTEAGAAAPEGAAGAEAGGAGAGE